MTTQIYMFFFLPYAEILTCPFVHVWLSAHNNFITRYSSENHRCYARCTFIFLITRWKIDKAVFMIWFREMPIGCKYYKHNHCYNTSHDSRDYTSFPDWQFFNLNTRHFERANNRWLRPKFETNEWPRILSSNLSKSNFEPSGKKVMFTCLEIIITTIISRNFYSNLANATL